jgi:hypothetical protein
MVCDLILTYLNRVHVSLVHTCVCKSVTGGQDLGTV